jgi:hypothetical protein
MPHRFRVGQTVIFASHASKSSQSAFKIVRPMPIEGDERVRYQIKCAAEAFTRIAEEHELSLS